MSVMIFLDTMRHRHLFPSRTQYSSSYANKRRPVFQQEQPRQDDLSLSLSLCKQEELIKLFSCVTVTSQSL